MCGMRLAHQESADICMLPGAYGLLSCACAACLKRDKNGTISARRMIGHPSPRLMLISKLQSGLLAISTWMSVSPVKGQCFRCSRHSCRC